MNEQEYHREETASRSTLLTIFLNVSARTHIPEIWTKTFQALKLETMEEICGYLPDRKFQTEAVRLLTIFETFPRNTSQLAKQEFVQTLISIGFELGEEPSKEILDAVFQSSHDLGYLNPKSKEDKPLAERDKCNLNTIIGWGAALKAARDHRQETG